MTVADQTNRCKIVSKGGFILSPLYSRKTKNIPQDGERIQDAVDIERWIDDESGVEDEVPYIAAIVCDCRIPRKRENSSWWKSQEFFHITCIMTVCGDFFKLCHE